MERLKKRERQRERKKKNRMDFGGRVWWKAKREGRSTDKDDS